MFNVVVLINIILLIVMIINEHKSIKNIFLWGFFITIIPIVGYLIYLVFGNKLKFRARKLLKNKQKSTKNYIKNCNWYNNYKRNNVDDLNNNQKIIYKLIKKYNSDIWHNNLIKYYLFGMDFLEDFLIDINNAKKFILLEFYIFADDIIGNRVASELIKKAKEGVKVKILYDAVGSRKTSSKFWQKLKDSGVELCSFFPPLLTLNFLNTKVNYRNHRKIVCIDGKISYTGGLNIRDDHMGKNKKLSPWRDTHIRINGCATYALTNIFLNDWIFSNGLRENEKLATFFPKIERKSGKSIQILESGPEKDETQIKNAYINIIKSSKKFLYIQTPYFVVENEIIYEIINAKNRGVDVKIFLPKHPDKKSVYICSMICIQKLVANGIKIFLYNGFIHSKVILSEDVLSVGSCNFDNRSFYLNFELTATIYEKSEINKHKKIINFDVKHSTQLTIKQYKKLKPKLKVFYLLYKILYKIV